MKHGRFITIEGTEGVGKTTNIAFIKDWLQSHGIEFIATREPGGTELAEAIRELLLTPRDEKVNESTELLLIFAARAQHLNQVILPALEKGNWVLCDRFTDATYAYQGAGRELGADKIAILEQMVQGDRRPDLTLILDIPVEQGLQRALQRGDLDRFEQEQQDFFERVRACYLDLASQHPQRYRIIDASQPLESVQQSIAEVLQAYLEEINHA